MNKEHKIGFYKGFMLVLVTAILSSLITYLVISQNSDDNTKIILGNTKIESISDDTKVEEGKYNSFIETIKSFKSLLQQEYKGDINEEEMLEGAIKGYVNGLGDEYTEYFTKDEMKEFTQDTEGAFEGIGVYIGKQKDTEEVVVLSTIKDSPAEAAGLQSGDIFCKVNDEDVRKADTSIVSSKVKGESGTDVNIVVERNGEEKSFTIKRGKVNIYHVETEIMNDNIGYMQLSAFSENCSQEFEEKYNELQKSNIKSLVLDLRNNGGGLVDEALKIADLFVDKNQDLLITVDKNGKEEVKKSTSAKTVNVPVIILTNEYSASASEILAGALKERAGAKIVGTTTYGKGVIQVLHSLSDGSGIKVTVKEYLTPIRNTINKVGIKPDEEVEVTTDQMLEGLQSKEKDLQLQKALELAK